MEEFKPITGKQIFLKIFFNLFILSFVVFIIMYLTSEVKDIRVMLKSIGYTMLILIPMVTISGFISYRNRKNPAYTEKLLKVTHPLTMTIIEKFGISMEISGVKKFSSYFSIILGIFFILSAFLFFNDFRVVLFVSFVGIFGILYGFINKNK